MAWQLQDAKKQFSEVVRRALHRGPQVVTRHGRKTVVVVAIEEFERLRGKRRDFRRFLLEAPDLHRLDIRREVAAARQRSGATVDGDGRRQRPVHQRPGPRRDSAGH